MTYAKFLGQKKFMKESASLLPNIAQFFISNTTNLPIDFSGVIIELGISCVKPHFPTKIPMKSLQQSGVRESYGLHRIGSHRLLQRIRWFPCGDP